MASYCHYLTGQRFGSLVVLAFARQSHRAMLWLTRCDCGEEYVARGTKLLSGEITTCPACGYRHDAERHSQARMQLPPERRAEITAAARAARKQPV